MRHINPKIIIRRQRMSGLPTFMFYDDANHTRLTVTEVSTVARKEAGLPR